MSCDILLLKKYRYSGMLARLLFMRSDMKKEASHCGITVHRAHKHYYFPMKSHNYKKARSRGRFSIFPAAHEKIARDRALRPQKEIF